MDIHEDRQCLVHPWQYFIILYNSNVLLLFVSLMPRKFLLGAEELSPLLLFNPLWCIHTLWPWAPAMFSSNVTTSLHWILPAFFFYDYSSLSLYHVPGLYTAKVILSGYITFSPREPEARNLL
jgi:hypothetical protein